MKTHNNITVKVTIEITESKSYCETKKLFTASREESGSLSLKEMRKVAHSLTSDASQNVRERLDEAISKEQEEESTKAQE